jgi:hypothetical protein
MVFVPDLLHLPPDGDPIPDMCRDGDLVVCRPDVPWPDRCALCNSPANGYRTPIRLSWHPPELYLLLVVPPLYVLAALALARSATVEVAVCPRHVQRRRRSLVLSIALPLVVFGSCAGGLELVPHQNDTAPLAVILGALALLVAILVWATLQRRVLEARRIRGANVWVKCGPEFLASLPTLQGKPG